MLILAAAILALGQETHRHAVPPSSSSVVLEIAGRPVALRPGIGSAHDAVGTTSKEAQAFYDQGLAYLHSYVWIEAARAFNAALRADPGLALAQVGLSIAYVEVSRPAEARQAIVAARGMASSQTDHVRRHIDARALQMAAEDSPGDAALQRHRPLQHIERYWREGVPRVLFTLEGEGMHEAAEETGHKGQYGDRTQQRTLYHVAVNSTAQRKRAGGFNPPARSVHSAKRPCDEVATPRGARPIRTRTVRRT